MATLGDRIKILRGKEPQRWLADKLSIPQTTLSNYENNKSKLSFAMIESITTIFRLNTDWLLFGRGPMHPGEPAPEPQKLVEQPVIPTKTDDQPSRCERLEAELEEERRERRELSAELREVNAENRRLAKEITELIKENAGFKKRKTDEENPFFDERRNISSSDILQHGVPD